MSLAYLPEQVEETNIALDLAERAAEHLRYSVQTLYQQRIDQAWVEQLANRPDLAEKIGAFVSRFGRLQDHLGEKLLPATCRLLGAQPKSLLDVLSYSERMKWLDSAEEFIGARKLRNLLVHEYMTDPRLFLEALQSAQPASEMLFTVIAKIKNEMMQRGVPRHPGVIAHER
ncbi:hypothetical protein D5125_14915 [Magnetovirga frankeli]|uniref:hypothetical protein n=1 Tax=Magnetovirga frankeli TaxID=947516 RepID=UPI001AF49295|nr:hypothetical protein D5125_14915 [gamma proteobacterium SS-5]